jgi:hypothetical protein
MYDVIVPGSEKGEVFEDEQEYSDFLRLVHYFGEDKLWCDLNDLNPINPDIRDLKHKVYEKYLSDRGYWKKFAEDLPRYSPSKLEKFVGNLFKNIFRKLYD